MSAIEYEIDDEQRQVILQQIGRMNVLAISGGRVVRHPHGVELPVGSGYTVRVELTLADDYTVSRVFRRAGKEWIKGSKQRIYCDEVGEQAYRASSFRSYDEKEW